MGEWTCDPVFRGYSRETDTHTIIHGTHASSQFLGRLAECRRQGAFIDVSVAGEDGGEVKAHRLVLSACSPYFERLFSSQFEESGKDKVVVGGMDMDSLGSLVDFMYTGQLKVTRDTAPGLLVGADMLLMEKVKVGVCQFLQKAINADNCIYITRLADTYACPELLESGRRFIKRNFEDVSRSEDFIELSVEEVEEYISADTIFVKSEETVVEAILEWCGLGENNNNNNNKIDKRCQHLSRLLRHVKLENLSVDSLAQLRDNEALSGSDFHPHLVTRAACSMAPTSRARGVNKYIVAVGFDSSDVEYLDMDRPEEGWSLLTKIPNMRYGMSGASLACHGDTLLVTGGVGRGGVLKALDRFMTYNVRTNQWTEGPAMGVARKCHASAILESRLYVLGGSDCQMSVLTGEVLDLSLPEDQWAWQPIKALPDWHNGCAAPVLRGKIHLPAAYGSDHDKIYDPATDSWERWGWEEVGAERIQRDRAGVGVAGGKIYIVGGAAGREFLADMESWDRGAWQRGAPLNVAREGPAVVEHEGDLWVIGGRGSGGTVERYNPQEETWQLQQNKMAFQDQEYTAVVIDRVV